MLVLPEIVAPAGTPEKLKTAFHFGADAVYLGLKKHSMRAAAGNFDTDELAWAVEYAHERGKRVYVTGFSLGGALATLCALDLKVNDKRDVVGWFLGSPRVGREDLRKAVRAAR